MWRCATQSASRCNVIIHSRLAGVTLHILRRATFHSCGRSAQYTTAAGAYITQLRQEYLIIQLWLVELDTCLT